MYHSFVPPGTGGQLTGEGGYGLTYGGGGPLTRELGQPSLGRGGPPNGPPGGPPGSPLGNGGAGPGDVSRNDHPIPLPPAGLPPPATYGGLKGTTPMIFDGNRKSTKLFMQEFTLYRMINQDSQTMHNAYTRVALVLSFMRGPAINDWVLQQTE
jgi:hypothetical protein